MDSKESCSQEAVVIGSQMFTFMPKAVAESSSVPNFTTTIDKSRTVGRVLKLVWFKIPLLRDMTLRTV
jgi:hypothetical protein